MGEGALRRPIPLAVTPHALGQSPRKDRGSKSLGNEEERSYLFDVSCEVDEVLLAGRKGVHGEGLQLGGRDFGLVGRGHVASVRGPVHSPVCETRSPRFWVDFRVSF